MPPLIASVPPAGAGCAPGGAAAVPGWHHAGDREQQPAHQRACGAAAAGVSVCWCVFFWVLLRMLVRARCSVVMEASRIWRGCEQRAVTAGAGGSDPPLQRRPIPSTGGPSASTLISSVPLKPALPQSG